MASKQSGEGLSRTRKVTAAIAMAAGLAVVSSCSEYPQTKFKDTEATSSPAPTPSVATLSVQPQETTPPGAVTDVWKYPVCQGAFVNLKDGWGLMRPVSEFVTGRGTYFPKFVHIYEGGDALFDSAPVYAQAAGEYKWLGLNGVDLGETPPANCSVQQMHVAQVDPKGRGSCENVIGSTRLKDDTEVDLRNISAIRNEEDVYSRQFTFNTGDPESLATIQRALAATAAATK